MSKENLTEEKKPKGKHPGGRPSKYKPELCLAAEWMSRYGLTDVQMAEKFGVSTVTLNAWKQAHPEFLNSLKKGKEEPNEQVEKTLFQKALGYTIKTQKPMAVSLGNGEGSEVQIVEYEQHVAPDVTAQIFWLKNRRPDRWRDRQEVEHSGSVQILDDVPKGTL